MFRHVIPVIAVALGALFGATTPVLAEGAAPDAGKTPYRLQPGDEVAISVLPRTEYSFSGPITPDGLVYLKNADPIRAAGLTLDELAVKAAASLEKILKRPRVSATLIRQTLPTDRNRIAVTGGVVRPGPIDFEPDLRLRRAIDLAGGPSLESDLRRVVVLHKDLSRTTLDLSGQDAPTDAGLNPVLQLGDSVEVGMRLRTRVTVVGVVAKPGPVEVLDTLTARKALELAGGALRDADLSRVAVTRRDAARTLVDLSGEKNAALELQDGDSVEVPPQFASGTVSIAGEVAKAGQYALQPGMTLEDLIVLGGKLTLIADVQKVELRRAKGDKQVIDLLQQQAKGADGRIFLEAGDEVFVPRHPSLVILVGAIPNPGARALREGQSLREFLTDGPLESLPALDDTRVDLGKVQLIRRGEAPIKINLKSVIRAKSAKDDVALRSGDILFLPSKGEPKKGFMDYLRAIPSLGGLVGLF